MAEFKSVGAAASRALQEEMIRRAAMRRQSVLDGIFVENTLRERAAQEAEAKRRAQLAAQQDADRLAAIHGPSADLSPDAAATLRAGGYGVTERDTLPARTIAMPTGLPTVAPVDPRAAAAERGQALRAAMGYRPLVPAQELPSQSYARRSETYAESLARGQRESAQTERDEARTFRDEQAGADRAFRGEQAELSRQSAEERAEADRALRLAIAQMSASNNFETRALGNQLRELQIEAEKERQDNARRDRERVETERMAGRSSVRELAQSLINDPALNEITGAVEGRRDTFVQSANVDALRRYNQLVNMLSLEGRQKLKGQGAVSDFEGRMLASASSALDRAAGPEAVRRHLAAIASVFSDDAPDNGGSGDNSGDTVIRWGRDANGRPVRLR